MKTPIFSLIVSLLVVPMASAQGEPSYGSDELLSGQVSRSEFLVSPPADVNYNPISADTVAAPAVRRRGTLRSVARGIARTVYHAGVISGSAAIVAVDALSRSYDPSFYPGAGSFVPSSAYGVDSCVHGYTAAACPYSSSGSSYGSMYLSGRETTRYRPDYAGGYRYYSSDGSYGTIRPTYSGGYRVTTASTSSYRAPSLQSVRYGSSAGGYSRW